MEDKTRPELEEYEKVKELTDAQLVMAVMEEIHGHEIKVENGELLYYDEFGESHQVNPYYINDIGVGLEVFRIASENNIMLAITVGDILAKENRFIWTWEYTPSIVIYTILKTLDARTLVRATLAAHRLYPRKTE